ncbi:Glucan 1,3-beta-glucosidase 3 [Tulasnella sp. JGI-2019a]|nr:Glucan 1,3-beta-glucosidase 3 [Tulasnella sp. JGI-2019a]
MHFTTTVLFALSLVHASVAASFGANPTDDLHLERRGCTPSKSKTPGAVPAPTFEAFDAQKAQVYRYQRQVGANAGNMFVHEKWMDGAPFSCATGPKMAEVDIAGGWGGVAGAQSELEWHWDNFITEDHISQLAGMGINTLRIPIGYWSAGSKWTANSPFSDFGQVYDNSWNRVLRTVSWCEKNKMGVLIDLHGAYGSQNGQQHSGVSDGKTQLFGNKAYIKQTQDFLVWLVQQFDQVNNVVGIELLNEPKYSQQLLDFYTETIPLMRAASASMPLYLHDGFQLSKLVPYVTANLDKYQPIIVDNHAYFVFTSSQQNTPITKITTQIQSSTKSSLSSANDKLKGNLVIGEMGCANADGQQVSNMDAALKAYCEAQISVYSEVTSGWIFWAAMMSGCTEGTGNGWCLLGTAGKYLPKTFAAPSGQISSGGVVISGGSGSSNSSSTSTSGDNNSDSNTTTSTDASNTSTSANASNTSTATNDKTSTQMATAAHTDSTGSGSCNASSSGKSSSKYKRANHKINASRRRHQTRALQERASDQGYAEGHNAAGHFARAGKTLGMTHAYVQARMADMGVDEQYLEHFKRGFMVGHQEGQERWVIAAKK